MKVNSMWWAELRRAIRGKTVWSSRMNSVHGAQKWAVSMIRLGAGQLCQIKAILIASQFITAQKGEGCCAAHLCPKLICGLNHTALMSSKFFAVPHGFFGGYVHHLLVVRLMNLLPEILTMIWGDQWSKERLLALSMLCKHTSLEGHC